MFKCIKDLCHRLFVRKDRLDDVWSKRVFESRLVYIGQLEKGWWHGIGEPFDKDMLKWFTDLVEETKPDDIPFPYVGPRPCVNRDESCGNITCFWLVQGQPIVVMLEVFFADRTGILVVFNGVADTWFDVHLDTRDKVDTMWRDIRGALLK